MDKPDEVEKAAVCFNEQICSHHNFSHEAVRQLLLYLHMRGSAPNAQEGAEPANTQSSKHLEMLIAFDIFARLEWLLYCLDFNMAHVVALEAWHVIMTRP